MEHSDRVMKTKEILGMKIVNTHKEKLGEIEEIVLDKISGRIAYIVLSTGNFLGMTGKLFAVSWHALRFDPIENNYVLDASLDLIKSSQGFNKAYWPDSADTQFSKKMSEFDTTA